MELLPLRYYYGYFGLFAASHARQSFTILISASGIGVSTDIALRIRRLPRFGKKHFYDGFSATRESLVEWHLGQDDGDADWRYASRISAMAFDGIF